MTTSDVPLSTWRRYWYLPVLAVYVLVVGVAVAHHEPWFDESQAWLIARDATWSDLFFRLPHYEGSPMLWHLLLALPARCGLPFASLNVISAAIASAGVLLFLARSPLPKLLTAMAPFTFFLIYQHAVVARSYVSMPLLLFACADLYPSRFRQPLLYVAPLCLLAHVSAHGLALAAALVGLLGLQAAGRWYRDRDAAAVKRAALAIGLFGLVAALAAWQIRPAPDNHIGLGYQFPLGPQVHFALDRLSGGFTDAYLPSLLVLVLSLVWFWRTGTAALYLVLTAAVMAIFLLAACWFHHEGILFFIWLFALWIGFQEYRAAGFRKTREMAQFCAAFSAVVAAVFALHIYWAMASIRADLRYDYSGAKAVAAYLKREGLDSKRIVASDIYPLAAQPYFDRNIFANFRNGRGTSFVVWASAYFQPTGVFRFPLPYRKPFDVLILGVKHRPFCDLPWNDPAAELPFSSDFRCVGYFPGNLFWKTVAYERDDYVVYVRKDIKASRYEPGTAAVRRGLTVLNVERFFAADTVLSTMSPAAAVHTIFGMMLELLDPQAATQHFQTAFELSPVSATYANLGGLLAKTNPDQAMRYLQRALELDPHNASAHTTLGNLYARAGKYAAAIACYRQALSFAPNPIVLRNLEMVQKLLGSGRPTTGGSAAGNNPR